MGKSAKAKKNIIRKAATLTAGFMLVSLGQCLEAQAFVQNKGTGATRHYGSGMELRLSTGYLDGEANEYVYWPEYDGHKASQLIWKLDGVYMFNAGFSAKVSDAFGLNADIGLKLNEGNGTMDDYDWVVPGYEDYTHWSHHDDVTVTTGATIDLNGEVPFYIERGFSVSGLLGYKMDNWEWEARGGSYIYSTYYLYDTTGVFPEGELLCTYEQTFHVPYAGVHVNGRFGKMQVNGRMIGSPLVFGETVDHHHLRDLVINDEFSGETMFALDLGASFELSRRLAMTANYNYTKYSTMKGDSEWNEAGEEGSEENSAGADLKYSIVSVGIAYAF